MQGRETVEMICAGIDVSKDRLDICILPQEQRFQVARNAKGLEELVERLKAVSAKLVVVEATGGFETVVAAAIAAAGVPLAIVNPAQVRHYAQALGKRAKSDPIDAYVLARFGSDVKPEVHDLPDEMTQLLSDLVSRRRQIVEMIGAERQREKRTVLPRVRKSIARLIKALEKELSDLDRHIDETVRGCPAWREKEDLMASVKGVGTKTARVLLGELPELGTLGRRQIASLGGLAPYVRQSGRWKGKSTIGGGRKTVRSALFIAAMVATRHNPMLRVFYQRLLAAGKPKVLAITAVARKLLTILNAILRDRRPWQPASTLA